MKKKDAGIEQDAKTNGGHQHRIAPFHRNGIVEAVAQ